MKYIVMDDVEFYMFPRGINHKTMAGKVGGKAKCSSAGFVRTDLDGNLQCYGESESLGIGSRAVDTVLAKISMK